MSGPSERHERGAVIVLVALLLAVVFTAAAMAIDTATQVNQKQALHDTLDAAVHAGAFELPGAGAAKADAVEAAMRQFLQLNDPEVDRDAVLAAVQYFCVVASEPNGAGGWRPAAYTIPTVCDPGPARAPCTDRFCSIPCDLRAGARCNTVRIGGRKDVDFRFGPVIGQPRGGTGALAAAACKGPCGEIQGSPLDIAVVVDRTTSMIEGGTNHITYVRDALNGGNVVVGTEPVCTRRIFGICVRWEDQPIYELRDGLFDLLQADRHRVALGTIHRARGTNDCRSTTSAGTGPWVPVGLTATFGAGSTIRSCVAALPDNPTSFSGSQTDFQGPMTAARTTLVGAPAHPSGLPPRKAVIFMTDGEPNLPTNPCASGDVAATNTKAADILVVTIAYRLGTANSCADEAGTTYDGMQATDLLARMATQQGSGATVNHCRTGSAATENADGDFFFCAPNPQDLLPVFQAALAAISENITLLKLPN